MTLALTVSFVLAGCSLGSGKEGSGVEATETRTVDEFTRVSLAGSAKVVITVGADRKVVVRGDDNLIGELETTVDGGTLNISENGNLNPKAGLTVEITVPQLEGVDVSGSGDLSAQGVNGDSFSASVSGSGSVEATGEVSAAEVNVSGSGNVGLEKLTAEDVTVDVSGSGNARVYASRSLNATISGSGNVGYSGNPANVEKDVSGSGEISPA